MGAEERGDDALALVDAAVDARRPGRWVRPLNQKSPTSAARSLERNGEHAADVVVVDVGDDGDVDVAVGGVEAAQPRLEERPGVGRAPVDEHPPRRALGARALDEEAVAQPCGQHLHVDRRRHASATLPPPPQTRAARPSRVRGLAGGGPFATFSASGGAHVPWRDARRVTVQRPRAPAGAGQQAHPVRRRRAQLHGQGLERRRPRSRRRGADHAVGADVPRRVRGRRAQPGRHDPLRGPQRAPRRPRRAHVCRVARHGGAAARGGPAAVHRRRAPLGARLRPLRPQLLDRARLHQHAHGARPRRHPAARGGPRPTTTRSSSPAVTPPSTPSRSPTSSTPPSSATASRPCSRHRHRRRSGRRRAVPAAAARCCCASPAPAASTSRASTTSPTCPTAASSASRRQPTPGCAVARVQAHRHGPRRVALPEAAARAARRVGARAHVGRDLPRLHARLPLLPGRHDHPPGARAVDHRHRRDGRARPRRNGVRGGRPALAELAPTTPRSPTSPRGSPTATRAPRRGCRCRRPASTPSTSTSPTS